MLLHDANCESVGNGFDLLNEIKESYISLGYPTNDLYGLQYIIFDKTLDNKHVEEINKSCSHKFISNRVLVEYGGPAFGSDCFPDKK